MNWPQLAWSVGVTLLIAAVVMAFELRSRRRFRAFLIASARQRWEIVDSMPPGEAKERVAALHTRITEIEEPVWADVWPWRRRDE